MKESAGLERPMKLLKGHVSKGLLLDNPDVERLRNTGFLHHPRHSALAQCANTLAVYGTQNKLIAILHTRRLAEEWRLPSQRLC